MGLLRLISDQFSNILFRTIIELPSSKNEWLVQDFFMSALFRLGSRARGLCDSEAELVGNQKYAQGGE